MNNLYYLLIPLLLFNLLNLVSGIKKSVPATALNPVHRYNKECTIITAFNSNQDMLHPEKINIPTIKNNDYQLTVPTARSLLLLASFFHAIDYSFTKIIQQYLKPEVANCIRYLMATGCFLPDLIKDNKDKRSILIGIELGIWCGLASVSLGYNLQQKPAGKVAFVGALGVLMPPMFNFVSGLIFQQQQTISSSSVAQYQDDYQGSNAIYRFLRMIFLKILKSSLVGPFLAICGATMLGDDNETGSCWSDLLMIFTPLFYAFAVWRTEKISNSAPYDFKLSSGIMLTTASLLSITCASFRYGLQLPIPHLSNIFSFRFMTSLVQHWKIVALMLISSIMCLGWPTLVEQTTLQMISSTEAYILLSMEPIFAIICARVLLGELISPKTWVAAAFIISACLWSSSRKLILKLFSYSNNKIAIE